MNQAIIEATLTHSPDACAIVRKSGEISSWNPSATRLLGHAHHEIAGRSIDTLVQPSYQREFRGHFEAAVTGIVPELLELLCLSKSGVFIPVEVSVVPIVEPDNQIQALLLTMRDLTRHQQTLDLLRDTQFKLQAIVGSSPSALSLKTPQGVYVLANPNLQKIHELPEDEIVGKTDFDLYPTAIATAFRNNDELVLQSREKHAIEEMIPINGQMRTYISHMFPIFDTHGEIKFISRISLDITKKKQTEAEVFKLVQAIEQSPISVLITDDQGRIEFVNNKFLEATAYSRDEVIGKTPRILKSGKTPSETYSSLKQTLGNGQVWKGEFVNRRKDGSEYYDSAIISSIRQADGQITHYVSAQQDVTESKRTQKRLEESEERFKLAMQGSQDGLWDWDIKLNKVYFSPSWKRMLGYAEHELPSSFETWERLLHPEDRSQTKEALLQAVHDKKRTQFSNTFRLIHKKGHWVYVISRGFIVRDEEGNPKRMVGTHLDRTEIEQLQHELEEAWMVAQSEANSNDIKSKFLATVNREIRAPLDTLTKFGRLIRDEAPAQTDIRRHAELMEQVTQSLLLTLDDLDDFAKIDAGVMQLVKSPMDVNAMLEPLLEEAKLECMEKGVALSCDIKLNCSTWVDADAKRLRQIVNNLISNAIKFTNTGEIALKVGLNPSAVLGAESESFCMFELEVSDTGIGIAGDTLSKLFKPFMQFHNDAANRFGGIGLGLTIVKSLLDLMGGEIEVTSHLGKGTHVKVKIPLHVVDEKHVMGKALQVLENKVKSL